jgi:DNA gyrase subunit A
LTQTQAQAILEMQLRRLAALERQKVIEEYTEVLKAIAYLEDLLANPRKIRFLIKEEVEGLKSKYGDRRRTMILEEEAGEFRDEDLIPQQWVVVTLTNRGYIKRVPSESYRLQGRGGRGAASLSTRGGEGVHRLLAADTLDTLLFFTNRGKVFSLRCYQIPPDTSRTARGIPLIKLISLDTGEQVTEVVAVSSFDEGSFILMATRRGLIKKTSLREFASVRSNGLIAMNLKKEDELVAARIAYDQDQVVLVSEAGRAIGFAVAELRAASRASGGVRGIQLPAADRLAAMDIASPDAYLLVVTANGFGKCTPLGQYRAQVRGGKGVKTLNVTPRTGRIMAARVAEPSQELLIASSKGIVIRIRMDEIPIQGRIRSGASLMKLDEGDEVVSISSLEGHGQIPRSERGSRGSTHGA